MRRTERGVDGGWALSVAVAAMMLVGLVSAAVASTVTVRQRVAHRDRAQFELDASIPTVWGQLDAAMSNDALVFRSGSLTDVVRVGHYDVLRWYSTRGGDCVLGPPWHVAFGCWRIAEPVEVEYIDPDLPSRGLHTDLSLEWAAGCTVTADSAASVEAALVGGGGAYEICATAAAASRRFERRPLLAFQLFYGRDRLADSEWAALPGTSTTNPLREQPQTAPARAPTAIGQGVTFVAGDRLVSVRTNADRVWFCGSPDLGYVSHTGPDLSGGTPAGRFTSWGERRHGKCPVYTGTSPHVDLEAPPLEAFGTHSASQCARGGAVWGSGSWPDGGALAGAPWLAALRGAMSDAPLSGGVLDVSAVGAGQPIYADRSVVLDSAVFDHDVTLLARGDIVVRGDLLTSHSEGVVALIAACNIWLEPPRDSDTAGEYLRCYDPTRHAQTLQDVALVALGGTVAADGWWDAAYRDSGGVMFPAECPTPAVIAMSGAVAVNYPGPFGWHQADRHQGAFSGWRVEWDYPGHFVRAAPLAWPSWAAGSWAAVS